MIALATQMADGIQQQSLFYATDKDYKFTPILGNPILPHFNPSLRSDFHYPKTTRDTTRSRWVMVLAEGSKIGFYTSSILRNWTFVYDYIPTNSGIDLSLLKCPDLYRRDIDGDSSRHTWLSRRRKRISHSSDNEHSILDGVCLIAANIQLQWIDDGPDFYATISGSDPRLSGTASYVNRQAIGLMNNRDCTSDLPYHENWVGQQSVVRDIKLEKVGGGVRLVNLPMSAYANVFDTSYAINAKTVTTHSATSIPPFNGRWSNMIAPLCPREPATMAGRFVAR